MTTTITSERANDFPAVYDLIERAFRGVEHSDHREQHLVERLRKAAAFVPELSLVAVLGTDIVGYILFSEITIVNGTDTYPSLALAPVAVDPPYQGRGIGGRLIEHGHRAARKLGYTSVVLLGHAAYYFSPLREKSLFPPALLPLLDSSPLREEG